MLSVTQLHVFMINVIILRVSLLHVFTLSVNILSVDLLSIAAPFKHVSSVEEQDLKQILK
jgi:hypothetical protein